MERLDVIGLGIATMDVLTRVPRPPKSDEVMPVSEITVAGGGPVATALVTLSRLGAKTEYLGTIAADSWGKMIRADLDREGVNYQNAVEIEGSESIVSVVLVEEETASRSILYHHSRLPELESTHVDPALITQARVLHLDGFHFSAAMQAATYAKEAGVLVSFDGGAGTRLDGVERLLEKVDVMIVAREFAVMHTGRGDLREAALRLLEFGARVVVITDGSNGSWYWDGARELHQPAYQIAAVDTTGAGDVYHGAYLFGLLRDWTPEHCLRFATAASALKCMRPGGRGGPRSREEVEAFIANQADEE